MEDSENSNLTNNDSYNFLLLSLYFYLKKNNYEETSDKIFKECKLDSIFKFPQEIKEPKNEKEKLTKQFIEFFYSNSFGNKNNTNFDLFGDFWNQFWNIFTNKMHMNQNLNIETLLEKEKKNIVNMTYSQKNINAELQNNNTTNIQNILQSNSKNTLNNISNIQNLSNNNIINTDDFNNINFNLSNPNINNFNRNISNNALNNIQNSGVSLNPFNSIYRNTSNLSGFNHNFSGNNINFNNNSNASMKSKIGEKFNNKNNNNIDKNPSFENEEEEEEENDIFQEMDADNGIQFTGKKSTNIIKQENGNDLPSDIYNIEHDMDTVVKNNIYRGGNSNSNLNLMGGQIDNNNNNIERVMSALPLRKDMVQNNNQDYDDM